MSKHLDWKNEPAVVDWLDTLRAAVADANEIAADMLRAPRRRRLGPRLHRAHYTEAAKSIRTLLAYAAPPPDEPEPSDPAGSPGH